MASGCHGLERLSFNVDRYGSTKQFKNRVSQLATELGVTGLDSVEAGKAYSHRSTLAHGQGLAQLSPSDRQLYEAMETTLRLAILRAIDDPQFATILIDDDAIRKRWPI